MFGYIIFQRYIMDKIVSVCQVDIIKKKKKLWYVKTIFVLIKN